MNCEDVRARFSDLHDGWLEPSVLEEVQSHLRACAACSRERTAYASDMDSLGASLRRLVEGQEPGTAAAAAVVAPASRWQAIAGLAAGLLLAVSVAGWMWRQGSGVVVRRLPGAPELRAAHDPSCPWRRASLGEVHRTVSYPVVADECLDRDFELVEANVRHGFPCAETLRLTYRAGNRHLVLEQHPEQAPPQCPGERVLLGEIAGCFERFSREGTSLWWSHRNHAFHLEGDVAPGEAVQVAQAISLTFGQ